MLIIWFWLILKINPTSFPFFWDFFNSIFFNSTFFMITFILNLKIFSFCEFFNSEFLFLIYIYVDSPSSLILHSCYLCSLSSFFYLVIIKYIWFLIYTFLIIYFTFSSIVNFLIFLMSRIQLLNKGPTFGLSIADISENLACFEVPNYSSLGFKKIQVLNQTSQNNWRGQNSKLIGFPFLPTSYYFGKFFLG